MAGLTLRYPPHELAKMQELFFPEERRSEFTSEPWDGVSFRHYRDPKISLHRALPVSGQADRGSHPTEARPKPAA